MRPTTNFQNASENNLSSKTQALSIKSKPNKVSKHVSGLSMVGGLSLLSIGVLFSNALVENGLEGIAFCILALGFSLIYYGVSEDNQ